MRRRLRLLIQPDPTRPGARREAGLAGCGAGQTKIGQTKIGQTKIGQTKIGGRRDGGRFGREMTSHRLARPGTPERSARTIRVLRNRK